MAADPYFSIVIPTFNRAPLLEETLASVAGQRFGDYELLVVDDGSTDGTAELLARPNPRLRALRQPNQGAGAARNLGIARARGRYIVFLDSDDLWFPWTLERYAEAIARHRGPALVMASSLYWTDRAQLASVVEQPLETVEWGDYLASADDPFLRTACALAVDSARLRAAGGFPTHGFNFEDHDLLFRLGTAPGFVRIAAPVTLGYRQHPDSSCADPRRTYLGIRHLLEEERRGAYPGDLPHRALRHRMLFHAVRHVSREAVRAGHPSWGLDLYRRTFWSQLAAHRLRYLAGLPPLAAIAALRPRPRSGGG